MSILSDEITNDPTGKGYAALLPDQPGHVVDLLNAQTETMHQERLITNLTLSSELGSTMARSIRTKLNMVAAADIIVADFVHAMGSQPGGNIGDPKALEMIELMTGEEAHQFTVEEAFALVVLSLLPASRARVLGLPYMTEAILRDR